MPSDLRLKSDSPRSSNVTEAALVDSLVSTRIAVLMTCHNRVVKTLQCLQSLREQTTTTSLDLFLVDAGSTDGTAEAVHCMWSGAKIINTSTEVWWNEGMRVAWEHAKTAPTRYDYYLWLNDDVILRPDAVSTMTREAQLIAKRSGGGIILGGSMVDPLSKNLTYGGHVVHARHPLRFQLFPPRGTPSRCSTVSGNCVLVSSLTESTLGNLDARFKHIFGDLDYCLRGSTAGIEVWLASSVVGECPDDHEAGSSLDLSLPLTKRLLLRHREAQSVHAQDWRLFVRIYGRLGPLRFLYRLSPYLRIVVSSFVPRGSARTRPPRRLT